MSGGPDLTEHHVCEPYVITILYTPEVFSAILTHKVLTKLIARIIRRRLDYEPDR